MNNEKYEQITEQRKSVVVVVVFFYHLNVNDTTELNGIYFSYMFESWNKCINGLEMMCDNSYNMFVQSKPFYPLIVVVTYGHTHTHKTDFHSKSANSFDCEH